LLQQGGTGLFEESNRLAPFHTRKALEEILQRVPGARHPDLWKRVQARRAFMRDVLGIDLDNSVLPLSNTAGWLPPWALDLNTALVVNHTGRRRAERPRQG
jgi:hypothetical protein